MICNNCNREYEGESCPFCTDIKANHCSKTCDSTVRICPRCNNSVSQRYCTICGFDMEYININNANYVNQIPNGYNPNNMPYGMQAKVKRVRSTSQAWRIVLVVIASIAFMAAFLLIAYNIIRTNSVKKSGELSGNNSTASSNVYNMPNGVSRSEYDRIKIGMSYAQVSSIIGGDAVDIKVQTRPQGDTINVFIWIGETNSKAQIFISFIDDKVFEINQEGLIN